MRNSRPAGITRRSFLLGTLLPLAGWLPAAAAAGGKSRDLAGWLRASFADTGASAAVGALYLRRHAGEESANSLARSLFGCELSQRLGRRAFEQRMRKVAENRARDFRDGELVVLDGWAFARTEARLLALLALGAGG